MAVIVRAEGRVHEAPSPIRKLYWYGLGVRSLVGIIAWAWSTFGDAKLFEDALFYEYWGYALATDWLAGNFYPNWLADFVAEGRVGWLTMLVIAFFYVLMGGIRVLPVLLILYSAITAVIPLYTYWITLELGAPERVARRAAWLVALLPAFVFWSGALYKEGLVFLALNMLAYHTLRLQKQWSGRSLLLAVASVCGLLALRGYLAIIIGAVVAGAVVFGRDPSAGRAGRRQTPVILRQILFAAGFMAVMVLFGMAERAERPLVETSHGFLVQLDASRNDLAQSYSGYLPDQRIETVGDAVQLLPIGLVYFLTVPHPWDFGTLRQTLTIPETLFWVLVLYPMTALGVKRGLRENHSGTLVLVLMTAGMCVIYALLAANVGTAFRMRTQVWLLWAPFAAWGIELWRERRRGRPVRQRQELTYDAASRFRDRTP